MQWFAGAPCSSTRSKSLFIQNNMHRRQDVALSRSKHLFNSCHLNEALTCGYSEEKTKQTLTKQRQKRSADDADDADDDADADADADDDGDDDDDSRAVLSDPNCAVLSDPNPVVPSGPRPSCPWGCE